MSATRRRAQPIRTCIGCGARESQSDLLRLQAGSVGGLALVARPIRGRSAYVHDRRPCIEAVVKSRILRRSLHVDVPRALRVSAVERLLEREINRSAHLPGVPSVLR